MKQSALANNIFAIRTHFGHTQESFADLLGVSQTTVSNWETSGHSVSNKNIEMIMEKLPVSRDDIVSETNGFAQRVNLQSVPGARPVQGMVMGLAPRLGRAHAGKPTEPEVFDEAQMVEIPQKLLDRDPGSFVVSSEGDCMNKVFAEGSDLVVSPTKQPQDKSIVLVSIDGADAVVRRMRRTASTLILSPESFNPEHKDIIITDDSGHVVELMGVVTWFQSAMEME